MTMQELGLIKDIIEAAVSKAVAPLNEELKKIKVIAATTLKENRERPASQMLQEQPMFKQLPNVSNNILQHTPTKTDDQLLLEKSKVVSMVRATGELPEGELSEDLIMSMFKM